MGTHGQRNWCTLFVSNWLKKPRRRTAKLSHFEPIWHHFFSELEVQRWRKQALISIAISLASRL